MDIPMKPGRVLRQEFEYQRHGTQSLIASWDVVKGEIALATVGETRTESDFESHLRTLMEKNEEATQIDLVMDCLNTHQSESAVRMVAAGEGEEELGEKGKSGILKSQKSRGRYLSDPSHRVVFHFTPKHSSWLNQIEIWFSILMRKLLRRGSFESQADLRRQILEFVEYFNRTMAKPFKWTYAGKPLTV